MKSLFVTWAGGGNSTPVLGLAKRLASRRHDVKVVSPDDMTARFAEVGVEYEVFERGPRAVLELIEAAAPIRRRGRLHDAVLAGSGRGERRAVRLEAL